MKAVTDILAYLRTSSDEREPQPVPSLGRLSGQRAASKAKVIDVEMAPNDLERLILTLEEEMHQAAADLRFEYAARLRDEVKELKRELRAVG